HFTKPSVSNLETLLNQWKCNASPDQKHKHTGKDATVEEALLAWTTEKHACNVPISGPILLQKAEDLAKELKMENFAATSGWLSYWKARHQISCKKEHGESADTDIAAVEDWITNQFLDIVMGYESDCIYNCNESGIFYHALPDYTLTFKDKKLSSGKKSKERLTVLFCCNMTGKHKLPSLIIGKSKNLRYFKGVKNLHIMYKANSNAWMMTEIFKEWLIQLDNEIRKKKNHQSIQEPLPLADCLQGHFNYPC
uniref:HTH CENPB-type domain-containing protein n=1 Tax=Latimeria chalumnae TaxID=7897 RepID=H3B530_LATCH